MLQLLHEDLQTIVKRDTAVTSSREAIFYPHLVAIWGHRLAHTLHTRSLPVAARVVSLATRLVSGGTDIHPGACLGRRLFLDHPTGIVIGGTAIVGDDVTLFQEVTLGARCDRQDSERTRRHPVLEDGVTVGAKASVLGPVTVGRGAHIGAHALVVHDVAAGARVRSPEAAVRDAAVPSRFPPADDGTIEEAPRCPRPHHR